MKKLCPEYNDERNTHSQASIQGGSYDYEDDAESLPTPKKDRVEKKHTPAKAGARKAQQTPTKNQGSKAQQTQVNAKSTQSWNTPRKSNGEEGAPFKETTSSTTLDTPTKDEIQKPTASFSHKEKPCTNVGCNHIHEYATCIGDLSAENGGMSPNSNAKGRWCKAGMCPKWARSHKRKRVHAKKCAPEEWKMREVVAGLREMHREGRYS